MAEQSNDSLNDFPDHLLVCILSFLPTLDAIRTSSLSRKWRSLWHSIPSLNFDYALFPPAGSRSDARRLFADFVDRTLILRRSHYPLLKLRFQFDFSDDYYGCHVDSWIRYAVDHYALELDLDLFIDQSYHQNDDDAPPLYDFPFSVLRNSRVRVLNLCYCYLTLPENCSSMQFHSLRSMVFDQVSLSDDMVSDLISGCPNLESWVIDCCWAMKNLKIRSSKLKELSLRNFSRDEECSVEIYAPNLVSLSIVCFEVGNYVLEASSLVKAHISFPHKLEYYSNWSKVVRLVGHVERLSVQNWWLKLLAPKDVFSKSSGLNNLKHLELQTGFSKSDLLGMSALLELSPNLETMILDYLFKIDEDNLSDEFSDEPINLSMPNLRQVKMKDFGRTENQLHFVELLKKQGVVLEKIVIVPAIAKVGETLYPPVVLRRRFEGVKVL